MKLARGLNLNSKVRAMKKWLSEITRGEAGMALPVVLVMLALGSLLIVPSLNYVSTSLKTGEMVEKNVEGLYAADTGVEDALWRIRNNKPASFPYSYQLTNVNGMSVSVVIDYISSLAGEETGDIGVHADWLQISKSVGYDDGPGIYFYTLSLTNRCTSNIKIEKIVIDFPPDLEYVAGSTGGDLTTNDPAVTGDPTTGIALTWEFPPPLPNIIPGPDPENGEFNTEVHTFQLSGLSGVPGVGGHVVVVSSRQDIGGISDLYPYSITAQARDATDTVVATIRAGVWEGGQLYISCWQVNP